MPKRKKSESSLEDDLASLLRKVHKLEGKIRRRRNDGSPTDCRTSAEVEIPAVETIQATPEASMPILEPEDWLPGPDTAIEEDTNEAPIPCPQSENLETSQINEADPGASIECITETLDKDVLDILGVDPSNTVNYAPEIRLELASRLHHWATEGLGKESRKDLIEKYPLPSNCLQINAPSINAEIKAAVPSNVIARDKGIESKQKQMASAISCLADIINTQLISKDKNNDQLTKLMDVARLLCDLQHADSVTRKNFILFSLKKDLKEHLAKTKIDTYLFGQDLPETLKSAKAVNKSSSELKLDSINKPGTRRSTARPPAAKPLNRKAAPARRQPASAVNAVQYRQPATTWPPTWPQQALPPPPLPPPPPPPPSHSSKPSSRQPPHQARRRQY